VTDLTHIREQVNQLEQDIRAMKAERGTITLAFNRISQRFLEVEDRLVQSRKWYEACASAGLLEKLKGEPEASPEPDAPACDHPVGCTVSYNTAVLTTDPKLVSVPFDFCPDCGERLAK
jgi:hypothetical protein